jgi:hypothetical protein
MAPLGRIPDADAMRKVQSMGNLHTAYHGAEATLARVGETEMDEDGKCVGLNHLRSEEGYGSDSTVPITASSRERKKGTREQHANSPDSLSKHTHPYNP